jgi:hypothetical protein
MANIVAKRFLTLERRTVFSHATELGILIHGIGHSDSIIAEFPGRAALRGLLQQYRPLASHSAARRFGRFWGDTVAKVLQGD